MTEKRHQAFFRALGFDGRCYGCLSIVQLIDDPRELIHTGINLVIKRFKLSALYEDIADNLP